MAVMHRAIHCVRKFCHTVTQNAAPDFCFIWIFCCSKQVCFEISGTWTKFIVSLFCLVWPQYISHPQSACRDAFALNLSVRKRLANFSLGLLSTTPSTRVRSLNCFESRTDSELTTFRLTIRIGWRWQTCISDCEFLRHSVYPYFVSMRSQLCFIRSPEALYCFDNIDHISNTRRRWNRNTYHSSSDIRWHASRRNAWRGASKGAPGDAKCVTEILGD